jgi:hypothetical protein
VTAPEPPAPASPLLGEEAQRVATEHLMYLDCTCPVDPYDPEDCASVAAEVIRVLEPPVAALVAERERLARIDERLACAAACDRLGVPDVASIIRDSAA